MADQTDVLLLVHGFPPREVAGTEQHTAALAAGLRAAGWRATVLAATRAPGRPQGARWREQLELPTAAGPVRVPVVRVVNNLTVRPLSAGEVDPALDRVLEGEIRALNPALIHVQHLQFLSADLGRLLPSGRPAVLTLHDRWAWCAAGGLGQGVDGAACPGPAPDRCAPCAAAWAPAPGRRAQALLRGAGWMGRLIPVDQLHRAYQRLPEAWRAPVRRGRAVEGAPAAAHRNAALAEAVRRVDLRLSPSAHLAAEAEALGLGPVELLPHGVDLPAGPSPALRSGLLFLGTLSAHKGPDLVQAAWARAFPDGRPGLRFHGPPGDAAGLRPALVGPPLDRAGVAAALRGAQALVLGSRWRENAPLVGLEARAAGCPVVAPRSGGLPELVEEGRDGLLYAPGDVEDLARALRALVAGPPMRPRAPPTVEDNVREHILRYERLLSGARGLR
ncbi:MAG: glycosyltransferase [Deltaproteobacteria bacterium]|nr:glycosyltransferase [Deltaproteobacteria bacterium]